MGIVKTRKPRKALDLAEPSPKAPTNGYHTEPVQTSAPAAVRIDRFDPAMPLASIRPSGTNPRKTFNEAKIAELADSIRARGVLEPLLVRPMPAGDEIATTQALKEHLRERAVGLFELIAGERRYRAAKLAGATTVPVRIMDLSDEDALEVAVIENLQREDLDRIEEAEGFRSLLDANRYTAATLAAKLGKSEAYIYGALKLLQLPACAVDAMKAGDLSASTAQLIGRIPNEAMRQEAAEEICGQFGGGLMTYQEARAWIASNCTVELKQAPFAQDDASLTPAGSCTTCPARTGNNRALYPDGRADICTDPACYREKVKAHGERLVEELRAQGKAIIEDDGKKSLFNDWSQNGRHELRHDARWVELDKPCHADPKQRTFREVLGTKAKGLVSIAVDPAGTAHEVVAKAFADQILRDKGILNAGGRSAVETEEDAKRRAEDKIAAEIGRRLQEEAVVEARSASMAWMGAGPKFIRPLTACLVESFWSDVTHKVATRRGSASIKDLVATLDARECLVLLVELVLAKRSLQFRNLVDPTQPLLEALRIDPTAIEKEVRKESKAKAKAKK